MNTVTRRLAPYWDRLPAWLRTALSRLGACVDEAVWAVDTFAAGALVLAWYGTGIWQRALAVTVAVTVYLAGGRPYGLRFQWGAR